MKTKFITDDELIKNIYEPTKWDVRVNSADIQINSYFGYIILSGRFDQEYRHAAALEIIRSTEGVRGLMTNPLLGVLIFAPTPS